MPIAAARDSPGVHRYVWHGFIAVVGLLAVAVLISPVQAFDGHAVAMHGSPKYGPDFTHFDYVNPAAPKGGKIILSSVGTYDSLNPFTLKGVPAAGLGLTFETLMTESSDEAFTSYGLIAERIEFPEDRSSVTFTLRPTARWHDGSPITVADVIFSFETLKARGHPHYRLYYANVATAEDLGARRVRFSFSGGINRELPLIMGQLPVLPKALFEGRDFEATTLEPIMGSGPYRVAKVEPGRSITYARVADWWGADLPVNRGRRNFEGIRFDYYRDGTVALEAFKAGEFDLRVENVAKMWATAYVGPAVEAGYIRAEEIRHERPTGMQAFAFNLRRPALADRRVREALGLAFDFEWTNANLFHSAYTRTASYFSNSDLAARGLPSAAESALLAPWRGQVPDDIFDTEFRPSVTDGSGKNRTNLRRATELLEEAGWFVDDGKRVHSEFDAPLRIEFLIVSPTMQRIIMPYARNLERLGVGLDLRLVDPSQYQARLDAFDFDMVNTSFGQSLSPGNEQRDFWTTEAADTRGSRNIMGIRNVAIDALVGEVIAASDRERLITATRALDRVLLWGHYVVPLYHNRSFRVAWWDMFGRPEKSPPFALGFMDTWWVDPEKAGAVRAARGDGF
jgi:microcin C transport system substrate-binding protein